MINLIDILLKTLTIESDRYSAFIALEITIEKSVPKVNFTALNADLLTIQPPHAEPSRVTSVHFAEK